MARSFVAGRTLLEAAEDLSVNEKLQVFSRLKKDVENLHDLGWVHRDLTPNNIIVADSLRPVLVDWDLAEPLQRLNEKSYTPRGTLGFSYAGQKVSSSLVEQDLGALEQLKNFLSIEGLKLKTETKKSWWQELF